MAELDFNKKMKMKHSKLIAITDFDSGRFLSLVTKEEIFKISTILGKDDKHIIEFQNCIITIS